MKVYVRSFLVALLMGISAATWAKDTTTAMASASFNGPVAKVFPQDENGVYRFSFLSQQEENLTLRVLDRDGAELYRERLSKVRQFTKQFRFSQPKEGTYTFLVAGKGWRLSEEVEYQSPNSALTATLLETKTPKRLLLHVDGAKSEEVYVSISDDYGTILFQEYVELDEKGYRPFNMEGIRNGRYSFTVYNGQISAEDNIVLR